MILSEISNENVSECELPSTSEIIGEVVAYHQTIDFD